MKDKILSDLSAGVKEEYTSASGIIKLFTSVTNGDKLPIMLATKIPEDDKETMNLLAKARESFANVAQASEEVSDAELKISYQIFFEKKMRPHFGCRGQQ